MGKIEALIAEKSIKKLEKVGKVNSGKIAYELFNEFAKKCINTNVLVVMDGRRIKKVRVRLNGELVMMKPLIQNNEIVLFHKRKYYKAEELLDDSSLNVYSV